MMMNDDEARKEGNDEIGGEVRKRLDVFLMRDMGWGIRCVLTIRVGLKPLRYIHSK